MPPASELRHPVRRAMPCSAREQPPAAHGARFVTFVAQTNEAPGADSRSLVA